MDKTEIQLKPTVNDVLKFLGSLHQIGLKYSACSYDVASVSEITPSSKICKPLVVYRFLGNVMAPIITLRT